MIHGIFFAGKLFAGSFFAGRFFSGIFFARKILRPEDSSLGVFFVRCNLRRIILRLKIITGSGKFFAG
jgi:hypothetical protein